MKSNCSSPWVNLAFTVFSIFFTSYHPIQLIWMIQFFLVLKACSTAFMYIEYMTYFLISGSKKAMMQFFWVWFLKLKQQDTRVKYNKDSVSQRWAEKRKKWMKTKKQDRRQIEFALVFWKKDGLKSPAKFLGKHLCRSLFSIKL